jgi:hypothetical protein
MRQCGIRQQKPADFGKSAGAPRLPAHPNNESRQAKAATIYYKYLDKCNRDTQISDSG